MTNCFQFKTQSILQHGLSVHDHYLKIIQALDSKDYSYYQFPQHLKDIWPKVKKRLYHSDLLKQYHTYHDCGKPFCAETDMSGRRHFKNHALVSYDIYTQIFSDDIVAKLIRYDMMLHAGTDEEIAVFVKENGKRFLFSLWMTSLAEIYSNADMFEAQHRMPGFKPKYDRLVKLLESAV